jgi:O-acetyl-ADP-ribose deacetylase (regulator of RNase III)
MEDIEAGLKALTDEIRKRHIASIALPPLGSGLGGLDWRDVRPRIEAALRSLDDVRVIVFEPRAASDAEVKTESREVPRMTAGRATLILLMQRYLGGLMDPFVTLLEVHKLMYFMQQAGEPLRLQFAKGPYGPYAENLRHVLNKIEGRFVSGYADGGDAPDKQLELVPGAVSDAEAFLKDHAATRERFDRVANLVEGFETPFGLELLATVHWVAAHEGARTADRAVAETYAWGDRKKRFSPRQIALALDVLAKKGWLGETSGLVLPD